MTETQVRIRVTTSGQEKLNRLGATAGKLEKTFKANEKELNRLQRQLRSTSRTADTFSAKTKTAFSERNFAGVRTGARNLNRFEREARDATRAVNQLARASGGIRSIDAGVSGGGGGGGAGGSAALNAAALSTAASVSQSRNLKQILQLSKEIKAEKKAQFSIDKNNAQILRDIGQGQSKVAEQQKRVQANAALINKLTGQRNILDGQRRANLTKIAKGQIKNAAAVKRAKVAAAELGAEVSDIDAKIGDAKRSTAGLKRELEKAVRVAKGFPDKPFEAPNVPGRGQGAGFAGSGGGARQINSTTAALGGVAKAALGAAAAYFTATSAAAAFNKAVGTAVDVSSAEQRIRALAEGYDDYGRVVETVERLQKKFNLSQLEATNSVAKLFGRLRPLGLTLEEIESVYAGFNTATALTGATAAESAGALLQLSQALGAGALRGEEFNSVAEQAPGVLAAIGKELNVPIGRLKSLAKEGKITSDVLIKSLQRVEREGADRLAEALNTPAQRIKSLQNSVEDLNTAVGKLVLPAVLSFLDALNSKVKQLTVEVNKTSRALEKVNGLLQQFKLLSADSETAGEQISNAFNVAARAAFDFVANLIPGIRALQLFLNLRDRLAGKEGPRKVKYPTAAEIQAAAEPLRDRLGIEDPDNGSGSSAGPNTDRADQLKAAEEALFVAERALLLEQQTTEANRIKIASRTEELTIIRNLETALGDALSVEERTKLQAAAQADIDRIRLARNRELLDLVKQRKDAETEARRSALDGLNRETALIEAQIQGPGAAAAELRRQQIADIVETGTFIDENGKKIQTVSEIEAAAAVDRKNGAQEQLDQLTQIRELYAQIGDVIQQGIVSAIESAIDGSKSLQEVLSDTLKQIGSLLINAGVRSITGGLFPGGGGIPIQQRADGGIANGPTLVGEKGPEIIRPLTPTLVSPFDENSSTIANSLLNAAAADAGDAFSDAAQSLGTQTATMNSNAAQAESAAYMSSADDTVKFETFSVGGMDVVSRAEAMEIGRQAAKNARARVFNDLKNKPSARGGIGL